MTDCTPNAAGTRCTRCGWRWKRGGKFPRRNCDKQPSIGLGDTIAKFMRAVGLKPCGGCKDRQRRLNRWFPYRTPPSLAE